MRSSSIANQPTHKMFLCYILIKPGMPAEPTSINKTATFQYSRISGYELPQFKIAKILKI
jgi:hypothetical protein